jgi:hypothetical protein
MPSYPEIVRSVQAALLLARGETRGMALLDLSVDGFWRSFAAAVIVAPAYLLVLLDQYRLLGWPEHVWGTVAAETTSYLLGWVSFPLAAIPLTRLLGLSGRYVPLVIANNWSTVVQVALYTTVVLVGMILPPELRTTALFAATIAVLAYQWFVIRTALATTGATALGLVVIDVLLSITTSRILDGMLQPG